MLKGVSVKVWDAKTRIELYEKGLMSEDEEDKGKVFNKLTLMIPSYALYVMFQHLLAINSSHIYFIF